MVNFQLNCQTLGCSINSFVGKYFIDNISSPCSTLVCAIYPQFGVFRTETRLDVVKWFIYIIQRVSMSLVQLHCFVSCRGNPTRDKASLNPRCCCQGSRPGQLERDQCCPVVYLFTTGLASICESVTFCRAHSRRGIYLIWGLWSTDVRWRS